MWSERGPLRYERLTWPEVRRAAAEERVALVPVATLEDHGRHLPVDTDLRIVTEICERAAAAAADRVVLLPPVPHGYDPHHMDFPGPITIAWDTFTRYCADVGRSLAHHGFRRMLFLNGHGSNQNLVEVAARLVMVERPDVLAAAAFYLTSPEAAAVIERVRDSTRGGMAHACELETSIYLAIDPDAVDMDLAVDERGYPEGEHAWLDWSDGSLKLMPWWSAFSRSGVQGDASKATADKGRALQELDARPWYVDGMLTQLGQAGKLAQLVGVAIGDLEKCDWSEQRPEWPRTKSIEQVLEEHLEPLGVPVLYKLPVGHAKHLATLPLGVTATLDADARTLTVDQPALGPADGGQRRPATRASRAWGMIDPAAGPRPTSQEACAWRPASR